MKRRIKGRTKKKGPKSDIRFGASKVVRSLKLGNTTDALYRQKTTVGADRIFKSPQDMVMAAQEYFEWCESNPIYEVDYVGANAIRVEKPKRRPFTIEALCIFWGVSYSYLKLFKWGINKRLRESEGTKRLQGDDEFLTVIENIEIIVRNQKYEGAAVGLFNATIISRDLGLIERQDISNSGVVPIAPVINVYNGNAPNFADDESKIDTKRLTK